MPDIAWNKAVWDRDYKWPLDGEEWTQEQAAFCGVTPEKWKDQLAKTFLIPYLKGNSTVLEIGPGHGRWSSMIIPRVKLAILGDISESCLAYCQNRFKDIDKNVIYVIPNSPAKRASSPDEGRCFTYVKAWSRDGVVMEPGGTTSDGKPSQPFHAQNFVTSIGEIVDFVFSFDTFVHVEEQEIRDYAKDMFRILKPQGMGVIHHVGNPTPEQRQNGARSKVGGRQFADILKAAGFYVIRQTDEWAGGNLKLTNDVISVFVKP